MNFQVEEIDTTLMPKATVKEQDEVEKQFISQCYEGMIVLLSREPDNADDDKTANRARDCAWRVPVAGEKVVCFPSNRWVIVEESFLAGMGFGGETVRGRFENVSLAF